MKELEIFHLTSCPYCAMARKAVAALQAEKPEFAALPIRWIEERENPALADSRDYYYVPAVFCGGEKLYECSPGSDYAAISEQLRGAFLHSLAE